MIRSWFASPHGTDDGPDGWAGTWPFNCARRVRGSGARRAGAEAAQPCRRRSLDGLGCRRDPPSRRNGQRSLTANTPVPARNTSAVSLPAVTVSSSGNWNRVGPALTPTSCPVQVPAVRLATSTNEMKHPAEGSEVWTRVRDSWWLVGLLEDLELQPQPCSDPSGRWSRWRRTSIRGGHGVSPWVYRGLSPGGGCGGCPVAVASGHEAAG
jgi:hypothetical protein